MTVGAWSSSTLNKAIEGSCFQVSGPFVEFYEQKIIKRGAQIHLEIPVAQLNSVMQADVSKELWLLR